MVGAGGRAPARGRERRGGAGVRVEPPAGAGRLVGGGADDRVPEAVAPRQRARRDEPARDELVERRAGVGEPAGRLGDPELRRVAGHRRAAQQVARRAGERGDLLPQRGGHGRRDAAAVGRRGVGGRGRRAAARELLQVERVAAAEPVELRPHPRGHEVAEQRVRLVGGQRGERDVDHAAVAAGRLERGEHGRREPARTVRGGEQQLRARRAPQQVGDELERRVVGPLEVVEQDHHGRRGGELLEQRADGAVRAVALVLQRRRGRRVARADRRQHAGELGDAVAEHPLEPVLAEPGGVVVERVDPDAERQVLLELGAAAGQDDAAALGAAVGELLEHPRLADARLAADGDEARVATEAGQRSGDGRQLPPAADERALRPGVGHRSDCTPGRYGVLTAAQAATGSSAPTAVATASRPRYSRLMIVPCGTPRASAASA